MHCDLPTANLILAIRNVFHLPTSGEVPLCLAIFVSQISEIPGTGKAHLGLYIDSFTYLLTLYISVQGCTKKSEIQYYKLVIM